MSLIGDYDFFLLIIFTCITTKCLIIKLKNENKE